MVRPTWQDSSQTLNHPDSENTTAENNTTSLTPSESRNAAPLPTSLPMESPLRAGSFPHCRCPQLGAIHELFLSSVDSQFPKSPWSPKKPIHGPRHGWHRQNPSTTITLALPLPAAHFPRGVDKTPSTAKAINGFMRSRDRQAGRRDGPSSRAVSSVLRCCCCLDHHHHHQAKQSKAHSKKKSPWLVCVFPPPFFFSPAP
ncbi:hypothetical protein B0T18DRAFT_212225 [Schizothecium vesticola]|uniref:Uncharacterized protein n=1 Tax=Schizothecium vesticola TaxID=314040 RepID=A0AA40EJN9_9PEZI|nr:hypothetical protein B0T18DRAFT_212225 [Schizothecium vesticola]